MRRRAIGPGTSSAARGKGFTDVCHAEMILFPVLIAAVTGAAVVALAQAPEKKPPVAPDAARAFRETRDKMASERPAVMRGARAHLEERYDLSRKCSGCHPAPYDTDLQMHDLQTGRFFTPRTIRDHAMVTDGKIKTFPLRGIKDTPPYQHDGRLLTLDDTVAFFNAVLGTRLTVQEKADLVAFMPAL